MSDYTSNSSCCFTGHRYIPAGLEPLLAERLQSGIDYLCDNTSISTYYVGGALGFDTMAAEAVIRKRDRCSSVRLVLVIPCEDQALRWCTEDKEHYRQIKDAADEIVCLGKHYYRGCMHVRNRYLVDHSGICFCYLTKRMGGTAYTVNYARRKEVPVFNMADEDFQLAALPKTIRNP